MRASVSSKNNYTNKKKAMETIELAQLNTYDLHGVLQIYTHSSKHPLKNVPFKHQQVDDGRTEVDQQVYLILLEYN